MMMIDSEWAVRDSLTGTVYPQPNKLIAEKVAEMHGSAIVIPHITRRAAPPLSREEAERVAVFGLDHPEHVGGDWRDRLSNPPRERTLPEMMLLVLEMAEEDAAAVENVATYPSARQEFRALVGYDVYEQLRSVILSVWPDYA